ncbi:MAG: hypothetical protein V1802_03495 [Candidatus Aenigmatarchaeota archaeon]
MRLRYFIPAAFLLLTGCSTKHEIEHATFNVGSSNVDRYIDKRKAPTTKVYGDFFSYVDGQPDGDLDAFRVQHGPYSSKRFLIGFTSKRDTSSIVGRDTTIFIPKDDPLTKELQTEFESVKSDFKK